MKSHRGRCGKNGPRARRLRGSIPAAGCNREANEAPGLLSPQPGGLKPFVDFCLAVSRRPRPADCFAGYDAAPAASRCGVARSGETAAGIAQHSRLQKSATVLQRPSWDLISDSLSPVLFSGSNPIKELQIHRWIWSGRRDSNPRHQPWQGCTLPTELRPHRLAIPKITKEMKEGQGGFLLALLPPQNGWALRCYGSL